MKICDCTACLYLKFDEYLQLSDETEQKPINTTKRNAIMMFTKTVTSKIL